MDIDRFIIDKDKTCLLVVDIQERLFNAMDFDIRKKMVRNSGHLIQAAQVFNMPIVLTEQYSKGLGATIPDIKNRIPDIEPLDKTYFDCMSDDSAARRIREIGKSTVIMVGIETHICILFTALSLMKENFSVIVASDAVCSRMTHEWQMGLQAMSLAGAVIYPTETIAFMLMGQYGTEEFKILSPLFK